MSERQPFERRLLHYIWYLLCFLMGKQLALNVKNSRLRESGLSGYFSELDTDWVCMKQLQCINPMLRRHSLAF